MKEMISLSLFIVPLWHKIVGAVWHILIDGLANITCANMAQF